MTTPEVQELITWLRMNGAGETTVAAALAEIGCGPPDRLGNVKAREGCDRCSCGCKYWNRDRCHDCGESIDNLPEQE